MSGIKRLFMLILVLLGVATMGVAVIGALMIFIPNFTVFGLQYVSADNAVSESPTIMENGSFKYTSLNVETQNANICVMGATIGVSESVYAKLQYNYSGFVKVENSTPTIILNKNSTTNEIDIIANEPDGLVVGAKITLFIHLPQSKTFSKINVKTNNGEISLGNADAETTAYVNEISIGKTGNKNTIELNEKINIRTKLNLKTNAGKFIANKDIGTTTSNVDVKIASNVSSFMLKNIYGNLNILSESTSPAVYVEKLNGNLEYYGKQGYVQINEITGETTLNTTGGDFDFGTLNSPIGVIGEDSSVNIGKLNLANTQDASFETGDGDVKIGEAIGSKLTITTNKGKVQIGKAKIKVDIKTNYGTIDVSYDETYTNSSNEVVKLISNYGKITANNLKNGVFIETTGASIDAKFSAVSGTNTINGANRDVNLTLPLAEYILRAQSQNNSIDIALGLSSTTKEWGGDLYVKEDNVNKQDFNVNEYIENYVRANYATAKNKLLVETTSGKITAKTPTAI